MRTSKSYMFTVTDLKDNAVIELKANIKLANKFNKMANLPQLRVAVLPRFGIKNPMRPKNWRHGWCRVKDAQRFDVYVRKVRN